MKQHDQRAQYREAPEPEEGNAATPKAVLLWIFILLVWGVGYYILQIGKPMQGGDSRSVQVTAAKSTQPSTKDAQGAAHTNEQFVAQQAEQANNTVRADGASIYNIHCSACHQPTGLGIPGAFPPLANSEWVQAKPEITIAIVRDGLVGPIEVAGSKYQGAMPNFGGKLSEAELSAVLSFIRGQWGNSAAAVSLQSVNEYKARFADRSSWTAEELKETFGAP